MQTDILVLGTGITARSTIKHLQNHADRSTFSFAIAGRSKAKLNELVKELDLPASVLVKIVDVQNAEALDEVVQSAKVIINTVGPYWYYGTPVVRACVRHSIHYVDLTGEAHWIKAIIDELHESASKSGSIIIPACGMDSIPSDIVTYLGRKTLNSITQETSVPIKSSVSAFGYAGAASGGSLQTALSSFESVPPAVIQAANASYALSPVAGAPDAPFPLINSVNVPGTSQTFVGGRFIMSGVNRAIVQRSYGLLELQHTLSHSKASERARYGTQFTYSEFHIMPTRFKAFMHSLTLILMAWAFATGPIRAIIKRYLPKSGHGPKTVEELSKGHLDITNVTSAVGQNLHAVTTFKGKGDPGYYLSCIMIAESALALLHPEQLSPFARQGGVLTPSVALGDVLVERLNKEGTIQIESKLVKV
ncbi:hypothetical protein CYLTODRAFT_492651 [Cylindrobasidium torrendii FP15055 ss-10]|uniref:Saccharopine dehydrogenase NADP binding domain-containing protein n=1 Tax=Cylindrobasidium torrendii FP15055 ss-10 TaxID=1314674 RepID=A0A0D7B474_9AGAR|nr:hypothetical protein CYLTODRAFT_492651 [Cylindrobasidium torrendii FP15055 ss-10]